MNPGRLRDEYVAEIEAVLSHKFTTKQVRGRLADLWLVMDTEFMLRVIHLNRHPDPETKRLIHQARDAVRELRVHMWHLLWGARR